VQTSGSHLNLDDAWRDEPLRLPTIDARSWGAKLRFSAPAHLVEKFYSEIADQVDLFVVYGSGDFHYLTALWLRRIARPIILVSFDNHPDWDIRPPKWCCGGWINRALELPHVERISVWGCGNFECWWPANLFGNRRAERSGKLEVHPWADERPVKDQQRRGAILRENWRERFGDFVRQIAGATVYVTIDLDCLSADEAVTNWENGRFAIVDLAWAMTQLHESSRVIAGDICGAFSRPVYARRKQRFASEWDHPQLVEPTATPIRETNFAALERLWPVLTTSSRAVAL
jgi:arginase family enzyme